MMNTNAPEEKKKYFFDFFLFAGLIVSIGLLIYDCQKQINIKPKSFISLHDTGTVKKFGLTNQNIVLDCIADGYPKLSITWIYHSIYPKDNKFQLYNGSLKIINLSSNDKGRYECEAKNAFGSKKIVYHLSVDKPQINENIDRSLLSIEGADTPIMERNINRNIFDDVTLKCNATGKTTPTVTWYYENKIFVHQIGMIVNGKQWEFSEKNKFILRNGDLRIINLSPDDEGNYKCEAINKYGLQRIWYHLSVKPIESKYQWISSDERRANFANRKLVKVNASFSNDTFYISREKHSTSPLIVSLNTGMAYNNFEGASVLTPDYELLEVYGNWEWKKVINQTIPNGAVEVDNSYSLIGRLDNNSIHKIYRRITYKYEDDLEILVVT